MAQQGLTKARMVLLPLLTGIRGLAKEQPSTLGSRSASNKKRSRRYLTVQAKEALPPLQGHRWPPRAQGPVQGAFLGSSRVYQGRRRRARSAVAPTLKKERYPTTALTDHPFLLLLCKTLLEMELETV